MRVKEILDEDFINYKKPAMFIGTVSCSGKCCIEAGIPLAVCQNDGWRSRAPIEISIDTVCQRYLANPITSAIVFGGLEPFEQFDEVYEFIELLRTRYQCDADVVIYTGYYANEIPGQLQMLRRFPHVIVKYGRYIPDAEPRYDIVLGVELASNTQYAERIS